MITSLGNRTVKEIAALSQKGKERNQKDVFVAEGIKMFLEAPTERICGVYVSQSAESEVLLQCTEKLRGLSYELVSDEVFAKISDTMTPQGILCLVRQFHYDLKGILEDKGNGKIEKQMLLIMLEDIQDPGNLGTMLRTAEGAGASGVILSRGCVDVYNPKTIRSTMGSLYRVPFVYQEDLKDAVCMVKAGGVTVYAAHLEGERYFDRIRYQGGSAFLIGNEGNGLRKETADLADQYIKIPMAGSLESLNAAVAAALLLYQAAGQDRKEEGK